MNDNNIYNKNNYPIYKINIGDIITVNRKEYKEFVFYEVNVTKKGKDGEHIFGTKHIRFPSNVSLTNGTKIKIKDMFEDFYKKGYETIFTLFINDFEIVNDDEAKKYTYDEALEEYNNEIEGGFDY